MVISKTHLTLKSFFTMDGYASYDAKDPRDRACGGSGILMNIISSAESNTGHVIPTNMKYRKTPKYIDLSRKLCR